MAKDNKKIFDFRDYICARPVRQLVLYVPKGSPTNGRATKGRKKKKSITAKPV